MILTSYLFDKFVDAMSVFEVTSPSPEPNISLEGLMRLCCPRRDVSFIPNPTKREMLDNLYSAALFLIEDGIRSRAVWTAYANCVKEAGYVPIINTQLIERRGVPMIVGHYINKVSSTGAPWISLFPIFLLVETATYTIAQKNFLKDEADMMLFVDNYSSLCTFCKQDLLEQPSYKGSMYDAHFEIIRELLDKSAIAEACGTSILMMENYDKPVVICFIAIVALTLCNRSNTMYAVADYATRNKLSIVLNENTDKPEAAGFVTALAMEQIDWTDNWAHAHIKPYRGELSVETTARIRKALSLLYNKRVDSLSIDVNDEDIVYLRSKISDSVIHCMLELYTNFVSGFSFHDMAKLLIAISDKYTIVTSETWKSGNIAYEKWYKDIESLETEQERFLWIAQYIILVPNDKYVTSKPLFTPHGKGAEVLPDLCQHNADVLNLLLHKTIYEMRTNHPIFLLTSTLQHSFNRNGEIIYEVSNTVADMIEHWKDLAYQINALLRVLYDHRVKVNIGSVVKCISMWGYCVDTIGVDSGVQFNILPYNPLAMAASGVFSSETTQEIDKLLDAKGAYETIHIICRALDFAPSSLKDLSHVVLLDKCLSAYTQSNVWGSDT